MDTYKDELCHYGVLGMRWGVRHNREYRARVKQLKQKRATSREKINDDWDRSTNKLNLKGKNMSQRRKMLLDDSKRFENQHKKVNEQFKKEKQQAKIDTMNKLYSKNSKSLNKKIATQSTGKTLLKSYLMGSYGALKYDQMRDSGLSRGRSAALAVLYGSANNLTLRGMGTFEYLDQVAARKKN